MYGFIYVLEYERWCLGIWMLMFWTMNAGVLEYEYWCFEIWMLWFFYINVGVLECGCWCFGIWTLDGGISISGDPSSHPKMPASHHQILFATLNKRSLNLFTLHIYSRKGAKNVKGPDSGLSNPLQNLALICFASSDNVSFVYITTNFIS